MYFTRTKRKLLFLFTLFLLPSFLLSQSPAQSPAQKPLRQTLRIGPTILHGPKEWRPASAQRREFPSGNFKLVVYSRSFSRGDLCYVEILPVDAGKKDNQVGEVKRVAQDAAAPGSASDVEHHLYYKGSVQRVIALHRFSEGWQGLFLIPPDQHANTYLTHTQKSGSVFSKEVFLLPVHLKIFSESKSVLPFSKEFVDPDPQKAALLARRLEEERALKNRAFSSQSAWAFTNELSHPRDMHYITSPFYASRLNQKYKDVNGKRTYLPPVRSIHRGLDFRGVTGTPIFAVAPGSVVLAHDMYYEGGFTIIDHGNGILTGYMHQSRLLVKLGDKVKAGQLIGEVGATGMVTGSHLHLAVWVQGIPGDPLSLLSLPMR